MKGSDLNGLLGHFSCFYNVDSHQDLRPKRSSRTPQKRKQQSHVTSSTDLFPPAEMHFRCLSKGAKTNTRERINFDVTKGKFI